MASVVRKLTPRSRRLTAAETAERLESSLLYQRREIAGRMAAGEAHLSAIWYLGDDYRERYLPKDSR